MTHSASSVIRSRVLPNSLRQSSPGDSALRRRDISLSRPFPKAREATHFVSRVLSEQRRYCEVGATNMYFAGSTISQSISMARTVSSHALGGHVEDQILPFSVRMCRPHSTATSFARLSRPIVRWTFERSSSFLRVYQPSALAMSEKDVASSLMACSTLVSRAASRMETAGALAESPFRERPVDRWTLRFS